MQAIVYDKKSPGRLVLQDVEQPIPKNNEVLVKIHSVSINAADYRSMKMGIIPKRKIFGADISGEIVVVGKNTNKFKTGDEVFADISGCGFGGLAEYVAVPENILALKPAVVPYNIAAALPMAGVTALQALRNKGDIKIGDKVLIVGAGGGVGTFAVQLAKYFGAEVTAVCSEMNAKLMQSLGADYIIDYKKQDFGEEGKRYQLVVAVNGNYSLSTYRRMLLPHGTIVLVGGALSQLARGFLLGTFMSMGSRKLHILAAKPDAMDLRFIMGLIENDMIKPVIDRCYPFHETADAFRYLSNGHAKGKVMIEVIKNNS